MNKTELLNYLKKEGFSLNIINAFSSIKREDFIPKELKEFAYLDAPLPIAPGATISQPYTVAFMLELLELKENLKILEIGSGSGYVLALINKIFKSSKIYGIERLKELVLKSKKILKDNKNIKIVYGDGTNGLKEYALYDRIIISASTNKLSEDILNQLSDNGILVASFKQSIIKLKKQKGKFIKKEYPGFIFVPMKSGVE
jgi:protein-L-isoaspartate(D-aspartate) O-methyltransferase